jgi:hypothetical protein
MGYQPRAGNWPACRPGFGCRRGTAFLTHNPGRDLRARVYRQLLSDVLEVTVHRPLGDEQPVGDLAIGQAFRHEDGDLTLPAAQPPGFALRRPCTHGDTRY